MQERKLDVLPRPQLLTVESELHRMHDLPLEEVTRLGEQAKLGMANNFITYVASVKTRVDVHGIDMRAEMPPILYQLAMGVAEGRLIPGIVDVWLGNEILAEAVVDAEPPIPQQRKLLAFPSVKIYDLPTDPTAEPAARDVPLIDLRKEDVSTLIDKTSGRIRESEADQLRYLATKRNLDRRNMVREIWKSGTFTCDRRKKIVHYKCPLGIVAIPFRDIEIMNEYREGKI